MARRVQVQVIPWVLSDSNYVKQPSQRLDPTKTVFVGALHGMMNAEGLAQIMNDLFGNVVYAGIDTDKHKYPIGERLLLQRFSRTVATWSQQIAPIDLFQITQLNYFPNMFASFSLVFITSHCCALQALDA